MPADRRLYMTFPIDVHRHPKVRRLPADVRWTFVEMNGEARIADNDGVFAQEEAEFLWPVEHLQALVASHPTRPLVQFTDGRYVIRDYAEHQQTRAERERLAAVSRENGRKGGRPRKNPAEPAETEQEPSRVIEPADPVPPIIRTMAAQAGITSIEAVVEQIRKHTSRTVAPGAAVAIAKHLLDKARQHPRAPQRYVHGAIARSPAEVQQYIDENALGEEVR